MRLQIIGESANKIPKEIKKKYKDINWERLSKLRNIISHAYFKINSKLIWSIIQHDIPTLKNQIQKIKEKNE